MTFAVEIDVPVHWGEIDRMGHLNNAMYARYVESARVEYFARVGICDARSAAPPPVNLVAPRELPEHVGPIVARLCIDFKEPVEHPDRVRVGVATVRLGRSSATHKYVLSSERKRAVVAEAEVVWVTFDYERSQAVPIPDGLRRRIVDLEATVGRKVEGA